MGREAVAVCRWQGEVAEAKVLLESAEIILRGDIRARIPRDTIVDVAVDGDTLNLTAAGAPLSLELGAGEAAKWAATLAKPLPTLAEKLGVDAAHPAFVIGSINDGALVAALAGSTVDTPRDATVLIAVLMRPDDIDTALTVAREAPGSPIWCVHEKGKGAVVTDAMVRAALRDVGFIDTKTSAVSDRLTATRYRLRDATPRG